MTADTMTPDRMSAIVNNATARIEELIRRNNQLLKQRDKLYVAGRAVLETDERGQGVGYAEAMDALQAAVAAVIVDKAIREAAP